MSCDTVRESPTLCERDSVCGKKIYVRAYAAITLRLCFWACRKLPPRRMATRKTPNEKKNIATQKTAHLRVLRTGFMPYWKNCPQNVATQGKLLPGILPPAESYFLFYVRANHSNVNNLFSCVSWYQRACRINTLRNTTLNGITFLMTKKRYTVITLMN